MIDEAILQCKGLVKDFVIKKALFTGKAVKTFRAVDNVDLSIIQGKTLGVVGESGSGKSTAAEIIGDLQRPTEGTVLYKGKNIRELTSEEYSAYRRNVQFIFQDPKGTMNMNYRIHQILEEPLITLKIEDNPQRRTEKVRTICEMIGLEQSALNKFPSELSGGQCQRIAIGRALIVEPEVIICDEAVSALDVSVQAQILNLLRDIQNEHKISYLFITHDIGVVSYMADEITVMQQGKIVEYGEACTVLNAPQNEYTKQLLSSSFIRRS